METDSNTHQLHVAAFLVQALEIDDDPESLAAELRALKRDPNAGIWTVELESSVGTAAFLVYHYLLGAIDAGGRTGQAIFDADLATLERAGALDTPGPRIMAHAVAGDEAFILATTPATFRALTGDSTYGASPTEPNLAPAASDSAQIRRDAASELITLLRNANQQAKLWLDATRSGSGAQTSPPGVDDLNEEEAALALFLLDDRSIRHLLQLLNVLIETAQRRAADALGEES